MTLSALFWALGGTFHSSLSLFIGGFCGGLANALYSGSFNALIYETCTKIRKQKHFATIISIAGTYRYIALSVGTILALIIYYFFNLTVLAWFAVLPRLGETITSMFFVEPYRTTRPHTTAYKLLKNAINNFQTSSKLQQLSLLNIFDRTLHWVNIGITNLYFQSFVSLTIINISTFIKQILSACGFATFKKFKKHNMFQLITTSSWIEAAIGIFTLISSGIIAPFIWAFASFFHSFKEPAATAVIQHELNPKQRATMDSIISLLGGISAGICLYLVGLISDYTSISFGFSLLICAKIILGYLYSKLAKQSSLNNIK